MLTLPFIHPDNLRLIEAIFYAINQRRDDVVKLLVECGANLLVMNRNGNTPCGLASKGQLLPETCELLEQKKAEQLQAGRPFQHYNDNSERVEHYSCIATEKGEDKTELNGFEPSLKTLSKMLRDAGK